MEAVRKAVAAGATHTGMAAGGRHIGKTGGDLVRTTRMTVDVVTPRVLAMAVLVAGETGAHLQKELEENGGWRNYIILINAYHDSSMHFSVARNSLRDFSASGMMAPYGMRPPWSMPPPGPRPPVPSMLSGSVATSSQLLIFIITFPTLQPSWLSGWPPSGTCEAHDADL